MVQEFRPQPIYNKLRVFCDSDHAGCVRTRKSTTGIVAMAGQHVLKSTSNLQSTIALSNGESEYYAIVKGSATALGIRALYAKWNLDLSCIVLSDSSAAR